MAVVDVRVAAVDQHGWPAVVADDRHAWSARRTVVWFAGWAAACRAEWQVWHLLAAATAAVVAAVPAAVAAARARRLARRARGDCYGVYDLVDQRGRTRWVGFTGRNAIPGQGPPWAGRAQGHCAEGRASRCGGLALIPVAWFDTEPDALAFERARTLAAVELGCRIWNEQNTRPHTPAERARILNRTAPWAVAYGWFVPSTQLVGRRRRLARAGMKSGMGSPRFSAGPTGTRGRTRSVPAATRTGRSPAEG